MKFHEHGKVDWFICIVLFLLAVELIVLLLR